MILNDAQELIKGLSDLPICVVSIIFYFILYNKNHKRTKWTDLFMLLTVASFIGAFVHILVLPWILLKLVWTVLYFILFKLVDNLSLLLCQHSLNRKIKIAIYIATLLLLYVNSKYDIYLFVTYAIVSFVFIISWTLKENRIKEIVPLLLSALIAIIMQACKAVIPYGVALGHIAILFSLFMLFSLANRVK